MDYAITALSDHTGAEIRGIDLARPVDEADRAAFYRAFVEYSVLVFRDQQLTPRQLLAAVGMFGAVFPQYRDNRSLLHKANGDYEMSQVRYLCRVMPQGDAPV